MFSAFANSFKIPELRKRILFTAGIIVLCRLIATVPTPGVNAAALHRAMESMSQSAGGVIGMINLFSGGALAKCAVGALGIMPYISASIIIQLMTAVLPSLERLVQEGESGRMKITQYTRYLTLVICVVQALALAVSLQNPGAFGIKTTIVSNPGFGFIFLTIVAMTTGTMFMMWLGEQITEYGLGNGISIIITINIVSRMPSALIKTYSMFTSVDGTSAPFGVWHLVFLSVMFFVVTAGTVMLTQGLRKIPINSTRKVVGNRSYGGGTSYMPLRVNFSGVMPIIFAQALLSFPVMLLSKIKATQGIAAYFQMGEPLYLLIYSLMILFFSYFWVSTQFNPMKIADDLKKNGAYVPGIRPGKPTADFLDMTMTRITLAGAIALAVIAVLPTILSQQLNIPWSISQFMGGTSLLIMVGVILETVRQMESHLVMRNYDGFLKSGKIRSARG